MILSSQDDRFRDGTLLTFQCQVPMSELSFSWGSQHHEGGDRKERRPGPGLRSLVKAQRPPSLSGAWQGRSCQA